jgi:DNA-directed RNA polymerase specialized sigma24 family protein
VRSCAAESKRARSWIPALPVGAPTEPTEAGIRSVADRDQLERGFRRLSVEHRTVIVLHHYLDLPLTEVAALMGASPGTTYSRLHHALRALRAAIEADERATTSTALVREVHI